jgi:glycerophosphoryl diester phosphodiesterase
MSPASSITQGADMVELDVSLTKDRHVIVYHDLEVMHREVSRSSHVNMQMPDAGYFTLALRSLI